MCRKKNKFGAQPTTIDNIRFPSKREANRYAALKLRERIGEISHLKLQPEYPCVVDGVLICKPRMDFAYFDHMRGCAVVEDSKGFDNAASKLKRKLVEAIYKVKVELS